MKDHDQELIVDLIDGRLSDEEQRAALALIDADPDLRSAYEAQLSTASLLGTAPAPSMTHEERSTLHASLRRQLHLDDSPAPVAAPTPWWHHWWAPVGGLATVAAVLIGAVIILPGTLSGVDSVAEVAMDYAETATTAAAADDDMSSRLQGDVDAGELDEAASELQENAVAGGVTAEEEAPTTTMAASFDAAAAPVLPHVPEVDLEELQTSIEASPDSPTEQLFSPPLKSASVDTGLVDACIESLWGGEADPIASPILTTTYEGLETVVVLVRPVDADPYLVAVAVDSCRELATTLR